jgi:hypothetical protein
MTIETEPGTAPAVAPPGPRAAAAAVAPAGRGRAPKRRLADALFAAFHQACDEGELEVAGQILRTLEEVVARRPSTVTVERRRIDELIAGHTRLWLLRHPEAGLAA